MIFVSYDSGLPGGVTSEWVDDKLKALESMGQASLLVTGPRSRLSDSEVLTVKRCHSLGWKDYGSEAKSIPAGFAKGLRWALASTGGRVFDWVFAALAGSHSHGKWSWIFTAFPTTLYWAKKTKAKTVFSTGGPSSAHFVALLVKMSMPRINLYVEFQDPFIGSEMGLSTTASRVMKWLEGLLVEKAKKLVYVTKVAAERSKARHAELADVSSIRHIYPGAWDFQLEPAKSQKTGRGFIDFFHVGTLYSNRNLDFFFQALDSLKDQGDHLATKVRVFNKGDLAVTNPESYRQRRNFVELPIGPRLDALQSALEADFLLLVQHRDSRSEETIPYKTYDYLNLKIPIFGLTRNSELDRLIISNSGYVSRNEDVLQIALNLKLALEQFEANTIRRSYSPIDVSRQFMFLLEDK
jgi:glycosyltransferase involved in cell wall biosynthesis